MLKSYIIRGGSFEFSHHYACHSFHSTMSPDSWYMTCGTRIFRYVTPLQLLGEV